MRRFDAVAGFPHRQYFWPRTLLRKGGTQMYEDLDQLVTIKKTEIVSAVIIDDGRL